MQNFQFPIIFGHRLEADERQFDVSQREMKKGNKGNEPLPWTACGYIKAFCCAWPINVNLSAKQHIDGTHRILFNSLMSCERQLSAELLNHLYICAYTVSWNAWKSTVWMLSINDKSGRKRRRAQHATIYEYYVYGWYISMCISN